MGSQTQDNRVGRLTTTLGKDALLLLRFDAEERLNEPFTITVHALSQTSQPIHTLLGTSVSIEVDGGPEAFHSRWFNGVLWEYEELGRDERGYGYRLVLRPKTEFLTLNRRNRIFQKKSVKDIAQALIAEDRELKLSGTYDPVEYCVQYQESDWAFVSRLFEYEGIYHYFEHTDGAHKLIVVDDRNTHPDLELAIDPKVARVVTSPDGQEGAVIWGVTERRGIGIAKVTVDDYDFESPSTALLKSKSAAKVLGTPSSSGEAAGEGSPGAWASGSEVYNFPAKYNTGGMSTGERYSQVWLDAHRRRMARTFAQAQLFTAAVGRRITLQFENESTAEYLILATSHHYSASDYESGAGGEDLLDLTLELMPADEQYRPEQRTPRPRIMGPQTALVVGPSGEEIHTDKYGRIKVQFPWDREGTKNENSSCFIRVVQSAAGAGWGSFALPRIGQEVVVEFLDGDPDRPLVTGAVYNGANATPETLPDNKTQFGLKTRITKGGGGYNQFWFEDKKGSEVVWFRAERDYKVHVVNKDEERVYDKGHRTTTIKQGNETLSVDSGQRTTTINKDETLTVKQGNRAAEIKMGNDTLKVSMGNVDIKVSMGKHSTDAMQSIELTCGGSKLKLDPTTISLEAMMIKIKAQTVMELRGLMIQSDASAMQVIKGGLVMIN